MSDTEKEKSKNWKITLVISYLSEEKKYVVSSRKRSVYFNSDGKPIGKSEAPRFDTHKSAQEFAGSIYQKMEVI